MTDTGRFEAFVREFEDMVYATALRLLGSPADAEDIAQNVFLRAFERFDAIGTSPQAAGWLKTVTRHLCFNHLSRYRARWQFFSELDTRPDASATSAGTFAAGIAAPDEASPAVKLDRAEDVRRLEQALLALPDHQRVPLVLFHFEEMSYQDIAAMLGVSLGKVKTDIHRGRLALRALLPGADPV
jgi:RNA polymerase sigma-70 factor (ECF subfamily)